MKKLFTLIALIGLAFGANAQRTCDLNITLVAPAAGKVVTSGHNIGIVWRIINNGPDTLRNTDSMIYKYTANGATVYGPVAAYGTLPPTDTAYLFGDSTLGPTYTGYMADSTRNICVIVSSIVTAGHVGTVNDPVSTNNTSCVSVTYLDVPKVSILAGEVSVYPNPAQSDVNFDLNLNNSGNVTIRVMDITGRIVLTEEKGKLGSGNHKLRVDVGNLQNGVYLYQLSVDTETTTGRFTISK